MNPITFMLVAGLCLGGLALGAAGATLPGGSSATLAAVACFVAAALVALSLKVANTWEKFVVLRAGKLQGVRGPGLFLIIPVFDRVVAIIDERIQTTAFNAEQALTRDTVPVNVDAIIFWHVHDAEAGGAEDHRLSPGDRPGRADLPARDDRLVDARRPALRPQGGRRAIASRDRRQDDSLGRFRDVGRGSRCRDPGGAPGRDVAPSPGRAGKAGPHHSRLGRGRGGQPVRRRRRRPMRNTRSRCSCGP